MKLTLPPLITEFVAASNQQDAAAYAACFAPTATIRDEGKVYRGRSAITAWFTAVTKKYHSKLAVKAIAQIDGNTVLTNEVSGDFEGSPIELRFRLKIHRDQIIALSIAP